MLSPSNSFEVVAGSPSVDGVYPIRVSCLSKKEDIWVPTSLCWSVLRFLEKRLDGYVFSIYLQIFRAGNYMKTGFGTQ